MLGQFLPLLFSVLMIGATFYPAIDLTAGEKERGTMETILTSSVGRVELVLGKFFTVMTASLSTVVLSLASLAVTALVIIPRLAGPEASGEMKKLINVIGGVEPLGILGLMVLILPLTMLAAGCGRSRMMERAVTVLPQPDSPTIPRVRPFCTVKLTPSTARMRPSSSVSKAVTRFSTLSRASVMRREAPA